MKFKPEDFTLTQYEGIVLNGNIDPVRAAKIANDKLEEWREMVVSAIQEYTDCKCTDYICDRCEALAKIRGEE